MVAEALADDVLLYLQVLVDEVRTVLQVRHDAAHMCRGQYHGIRLFLVKEPLHGHAVQQVQFFMALAHQVRISSLQEVVPDGRTHQSVVSCHIYSR